MIDNQNSYLNMEARLINFYSHSEKVLDEIKKISLYLEQSHRINLSTKTRYFGTIISVEKKMNWDLSQSSILNYLNSQYFINLSFRTKYTYWKTFCKYLKWRSPKHPIILKPKFFISKYNFLKIFLDKNCIFHCDYIILQRVLVEAINNFFNKTIFSRKNCGGLTQFLRKNNIFVEGDFFNRRRYRGVKLNANGLKYHTSSILNTELVKKRLKSVKNLTSQKACKVASCEPCIQEMKKRVKIFNKKMKTESERINLAHSIKILKNIEKLLYRLNVYRRPQIKIALAIYLSSMYSKNFIVNSIIKTSVESIRKLEKIIYSKFPIKWNQLNKYRKKPSKTCIHCKETFFSNCENQKYCSPKCRSSRHYQNHKDKLIEYAMAYNKKTLVKDVNL